MENTYSRRKFMKTVVVSAGTVGAGGLAGCGSGDKRTFAEDLIGELVEPSRSVDNGSIYPQSVASGDPRPNSIVLWTRVDNGLGNQTVTLQVATDQSFTDVIVQSHLTAKLSSDHCVKVKVKDLSQYTRYYYRFITDGTPSRTGRFKTAPGNHDDVDVKFGFVSCQDYTNGYYNTLLKFLETDNDDIDFIVHLGDYIYETTRDDFQAPKAGREINFTDVDGAIDRSPTETNPEDKSYAAQSLSNYRELYKIYRTDNVLQKLHECFAFICIWDDHEFSDDSWGDNATYTSGLPLENGSWSDENSTEFQPSDRNTERKRNAEQAFFEFTPIDIEPSTGSLLAEGQTDINGDELYQSMIYRAFRYGQNLNLILTDFRTYRPDHAIPEHAYPGTITMTQYQVGQVLYQANKFNMVAAVKGAGGTLPLPYDPTSTSSQDLESDEPYPWATVSDSDKSIIENEVLNLVNNNDLPLLPYVDIDSVVDASFLGFIATVDGTFRSLEGSPGVPTFIYGFLTTPGSGNLKEFLIYILSLAYQTPSDSSGINVSNLLDSTEAAIKAQQVATGNLNVNALNATLVSFYDTLLISAQPIVAGMGINYDATPSIDGSLTQSQRDDAFTALQALNAGYALTRLIPDGSVGSDDNNPFTCAQAPSGAGNAADLELITLTTNADWGFRGFGVPWALLGKTSLAGSFGSRYLVVKDTYDLYSGFVLTALTDTYRSMTHASIPAEILALPVDDSTRASYRSAADDAGDALLIQNEGQHFNGFGNPWGDNQQTSVLINLSVSDANWNVLGSSVSFTSLILDYVTNYKGLGYPTDLRDTLIGAAEFCIEDDPDTANPTDPDSADEDDPSTSPGVLPEARYYMNVDHWDGFPQTRTTYMNNKTYSLPSGIKTFQDANTVIISGDIHSTFVTEHGANESGTGRCCEITVPAVSSGTFGDFTHQSLIDFGIPEATADNVVSNLGLFLQQGAAGDATVSDQPQEIKYANPNQNGVAIVSITSSSLTASIHHLPTDTVATLLSQPFQNYNELISLTEFRSAAEELSDTFNSQSYTTTKGANGQNSELS